jgi:hypothetical protein
MAILSAETQDFLCIGITQDSFVASGDVGDAFDVTLAPIARGEFGRDSHVLTTRAQMVVFRCKGDTNVFQVGKRYRPTFTLVE